MSKHNRERRQARRQQKHDGAAAVLREMAQQSDRVFIDFPAEPAGGRRWRVTSPEGTTVSPCVYPTAEAAGDALVEMIKRPSKE